MDKNPKSAILDRGLKPKKSFGQNFMVNDSINALFVSAASSWGKDLPVLEIGAGTGSLTAHLVEHFSMVHAVERDRDLVPILREHFAEEIAKNKLKIHEADGARFSIEEVFCESSPGIMVGNLPYHLTSSVIILALKNHRLLKGAVFMVQKEVAERLTSLPNSKDYGFLTAILNLAFGLESVADVHKSSFWPAPRVDSAIIKMTACDRGISAITDIQDFLVFVRSIFQKRRKKLSTILGSQISKEALAQIGIDANMRPEQLEPAQFVAIYKACQSRL